MKRRLITTGFLCLLAGCANYPGQRTKAKWNAPSAAEQQRLITARGREAAEQNGHSNSSRRERGRERKKPNVDPGLRPSDVVTVGMMQHRLRFRNKSIPRKSSFLAIKNGTPRLDSHLKFPFLRSRFPTKFPSTSRNRHPLKIDSFTPTSSKSHHAPPLKPLPANPVFSEPRLKTGFWP